MNWHDTPEFERIRNQRVATLAAKDTDAASHICCHGGADFFMTSPRGETWFLCRQCCQHNVEIELLCLDEAPRIAA